MKRITHLEQLCARILVLTFVHPRTKRYNSRRETIKVQSVAYQNDTLMTHKYRGCIVVLSINKSVKPNEEQKVLMSGFDQGFTVNTSKQVFRGNWQYE
jgi:hypothetical protein